MIVMKSYTITYTERTRDGKRVTGHRVVRAKSADTAIGFFRWKSGFSKNLLSVTAKLIK